jgi:hypothetical protein
MKRRRNTKSSIGMDSKAAIPIELIGNVEEWLEVERKD